MQRVFTQDIGTHFTKGAVRDYPLYVWRHIATNAGKPLEKFTQPFEIDTAARESVEASSPRTRGR